MGLEVASARFSTLPDRINRSRYRLWGRASGSCVRCRINRVEEPLGAVDRRQLRSHFDLQLAAVLHVRSKIDCRHATLAELALDRVLARESRLESSGRVGHA